MFDIGGMGDGFEAGIGEYFQVKFPDDWPDDLKYDFDWGVLKEQEEGPFITFDY